MYEYQTERFKLFTEEGQIAFLKIRDNVKRLLNTAGAFTMEKAIQGSSVPSWLQLACVDYLVELNEIMEITKKGTVAGQDRVFVSI